MTENKRKHLEFIQGAISRIAGNLFLLKGWGISLVVVSLGLLTYTGATPRVVMIAALPVVTFWLLDGYFLSQERQYRALYAGVAGKAEADIDFSMDASKFDKGYNTWWCAFFSKTLVIFYGFALLTIATVAYLG